jgi:uncharacterized protein
MVIAPIHIRMGSWSGRNGNIHRLFQSSVITAPTSTAAQGQLTRLPEHTRRIGVIADTHVPHRISALPARLFDVFAGCDAILHAGDLEDPGILKSLARIAPVLAVRGNLHWQFSTGTHDQDLPLALRVAFGPHRIWMTHGHFSFAHSIIDKASGYLTLRNQHRVNDLLIRRLRAYKPPDTTLVVFGHSHLSTSRMHDGVMYFNPGAVAAQRKRYREGPRVGLLNFDGATHGAPKPEWIDLDENA